MSSSLGAIRGPVLVTGAGSGIGRATVQALLEAGVPVFAAARRETHLQQLRALGAHALALDVRDPAQVAAAAAQVQTAGQGLYGLVHNAGVGGIGLLPSWPDADVQALFDTNVFGPHRLTNALLPLLLQSRGRIVCIGSQGGSVTMPFMGPYTMSKHALEAYAACLRMELAPHRVAVSIVQPGAVKTDIGDNGREGNESRLRATPAPFDDAAQAALHGLRHPTEARPDEPESARNRRSAEPAAVAATVLQALAEPEPQARYLFGTRWEGDRVIAALTERLLDAACSPSHGWDEDAWLAHCRQAWRVRSSG